MFAFFASGLGAQIRGGNAGGASLSCREEETNERYELLISKEKTEGLTTAEKEELNNFEILEHIMRRAKI